MEKKELIKEAAVIILASAILAAAISFRNNSILYISLISFFIIILANSITKKIVSYFLEIDVKIKFWSWYQYWVRKDSHFKRPLPMFWLPLILSLISKGYFWWLAILEFDVTSKVERVSKRHGLYRFTEVTEWHIAGIAVAAIIVNLILAIIAYVIPISGFETFAKLSIYYCAWSIVPLSSLDGSKIFFASRKLWLITAIIVGILTLWALTTV